MCANTPTRTQFWPMGRLLKSNFYGVSERPKNAYSHVSCAQATAVSVLVHCARHAACQISEFPEIVTSLQTHALYARQSKLNDRGDFHSSPTYVEYLPLHLGYIRICATAWKVLSRALLLSLQQGLGASCL